jgi:hypothetical protein|tara:strand:- start:8 stop:181 length:174 start_codon:yes stop_codon:yes gene_type:complete
MLEDIDADLLQSLGGMIFESPDKGKTVRSRPSPEHPVGLLTNGTLPIDIWYKLYGNG